LDASPKSKLHNVASARRVASSLEQGAVNGKKSPSPSNATNGCILLPDGLVRPFKDLSPTPAKTEFKIFFSFPNRCGKPRFVNLLVKRELFLDGNFPN
jgi:hypothetical protein